MQELIEIQNLKKYYGTGHTQVKAVDEISVTFKKGEVILIMGPSGSGKTTFLTMLGGLLKPTEGKIYIKDEEITRLSENKLPSIRRKNIGFIFQSFQLFSALTAVENVSVPLLIAGKNYKSAIRSAEELLIELNLGKRLHNLPKDLSGGEKQRVAIARALISNPNIILADEPTANLDSKNGQEVMELLCNKACKWNRTLIIVSHDQRIKEFAQRVLIIEDGKITNELQGGHNTWCQMHKLNFNLK